MDRAELLNYYSKRYLSRQEILFKLPFNIPAEEFWRELADRRKMNAIILPLHNAHGRPYWYAMTEKMIKASDILCAEAMKYESIDPYRMEMTEAMTWEMFFTSYLEGAHIEMDTALDYLSRDDAPEDVQEQVLWNNRQALCAVVGGVYRPVDEVFIKQLAYLLTQDLNVIVTDYRSSDNHTIAVFGGDNYSVPKAADVPARMRELFVFLAQSDIHPLIKAAVGQAFILTTRPFADGNERLSRMLSCLILYRSGYDYFRDISISRKTAQESYLYYRNMREILREENDGDLTYFVEYYIDLLARTLTDENEQRKQSDNNRHNEIIVKERVMAKTSLTVTKTTEIKTDTNNIDNLLSDLETVDISNGETHADNAAPNNHDLGTASNTEFGDVINKFCRSRISAVRNIGATVKKLLDQGIRHFSVKEWQSFAGVSKRRAKDDCDKMRDCGIIVNVSKKYFADYYFVDHDMPMSAPETFRAQTEQHRGSAEKAVNMYDEKSIIAVCDSAQLGDNITKKIIDLSNSSTDKDRRITETLIPLIQQHKLSFANHEWCSVMNYNVSTANRDFRYMMGLGLIYRTETTNGHYEYHIGQTDNEYNVSFLSPIQEKYEAILRDTFTETFTASEAAEAIGISVKSLSYHLGCVVNAGHIIPVKDTYPKRYAIARLDETQKAVSA